MTTIQTAGKTLDRRLHREDPLDQGAIRLVRRLVESGYHALWAGGTVRDRLRGATSADIDIAASATPDEVLELFPGAMLVGESFGVVRVHESGHWYEAATFREDGVYLDGRHPELVHYSLDPETDAKRRDFTVNALFYDPLQSRVIDYVEGLPDLENRIIRTVGDPIERFREDRLRLLRAIRFAAMLDFDIEKQTWRAIEREASSIGRISAERIRDEVLRMLANPRAGAAFRLLSECGLLDAILPEVERLKGVEQPAEFHPEGDVFVHTMLLLDHLENPTPELGMAAVFHDIGKPDTFEIRDRIRFNGHDKLGAEMFVKIASRLRLSRRQTERVRSLIADHMKLGQIKKMRESRRKRLLRSDYFPELLELHRLDCLASHRDLDIYEYCRDELKNLSEEQLKPPALLTGHDLVSLGLEPGPLFGKILAEVEDAQLENRIQDKVEALDFVRAKYLEGGGEEGS